MTPRLIRCEHCAAWRPGPVETEVPRRGRCLRHAPLPSAEPAIAVWPTTFSSNGCMDAIPLDDAGGAA